MFLSLSFPVLSLAASGTRFERQDHVHQHESPGTINSLALTDIP